jgi:ATP-binding cassette subfamily F protein 3
MAAVVERVLAGLDEDLLEYVTGLCEDADDDAELAEAVAAFCLSSELCEEEDEAAAKAQELLEALGRGAQKPVAIAKTLPASKARAPSAALLAAKSVFTAPHVVAVAPVAAAAKGPQKEKKLKKAPKKVVDRTSVAHKKAELEAEMEAARVRACRARWARGAHKGAIEARSFSLANPGGGLDLIDDAAFTLVRGRRYALVGRNGKGKSTLLQAVAARRVGSVPEACAMHYVHQDITLSEEQEDLRPVDVVLDADVERRVLLSDVASINAKLKDANAQEEVILMKELQKTEERLETCEADSAHRRADELLQNLGFSEALRGRRMRELSGGWRVRTFLASALFARPDVLLLDEPTNHLSIAAVLWLARELTTNEIWADRVIVCVSHDRTFLEDVCGDVLHISGHCRRLTQTHGDYATFAARRAEKLLHWQRSQQKREHEVETLKEYAGHGFRYGGSSSQIKKMKMKAKQADKMQEVIDEEADEGQDLLEDQELPLELQCGGSLPGNLIALKDVGFRYPNGEWLFRGAELGVDGKSRIVFLGENGNGKTTLVKLLTGSLEPVEGECKRASGVRIALVNQHHADQLDLKKTPLQFLLDKFPGNGGNDHELKLRSHLAKCGVTGGTPDLQNIPAAALSGGQRSRVALAAVSYTAPHVLVMDEPTNNLDLESVAALAECVRGFQGAVVVVSHDQFFVDAVCNEAWVVNGGKVKRAASFRAYVEKQVRKLEG